MNKVFTKLPLRNFSYVFLWVLSTNFSYAAFLNNNSQGATKVAAHGNLRDNENIYVASNNSVQQLFFVIGGALNKPFIVSTEAAKKRVTGNFDLSKPKELLNTLASRTGLIWYDDGSSVYVYDANEIKSNIVRLSYAPFDRLVDFMKTSGLYDDRFPLRSDGHSGSFYVSGPPVYVDLIEAAAKYIDATYARPGTGEKVIRVIQLKNTFVNDRTYTLRDSPVTVPGVARVLDQLLNGSNSSLSGSSASSTARVSLDNDTRSALEAASATQNSSFPALPSFNSISGKATKQETATPSYDQSSIRIVGYSDTNSLLVQGSERQVSYVEDLVNAIDVPKHQIQLSLWIIDISKNDINELGVRWQGPAKVANNGFTFNTTSLTPENSIHFLADVSALIQKGNAQIVSRPEILAQENVPALFDNHSSFYTKITGERTASLEKITYGTLISVLPRLAQHQQEIEMILNIQDGGLPLNSSGSPEYVDSLPIVSETQISTEARVPVGYSLLVGGYSRNQDETQNIGIPLLRDIPWVGKLFNYSYSSQKKMVRLFLIQPSLLENGATWQGRGPEENNPVLGRRWVGSEVRLKATVSMLRNMMKDN